jgi:hypothetical protein
VSGSFGCMSVHLGTDTRIICHTYSDNGPILSVNAGDVDLTVHVARHQAVDETDVANAKALFDAIATYLAECERIYHETHHDADAGTGMGAEAGCGEAAGPAEDAAA